jgi:hypothetical protein
MIGEYAMVEPDILDELLNMAKKPDDFTKSDLGEMILVAATEIIRLRQFGALEPFRPMAFPAKRDHAS